MNLDWSALVKWMEDRYGALLTMAAVLVAILVVHFVVFRLAARWAKRSQNDIDDLLVRYLRPPTRWLGPELVVLLLLPTLDLRADVHGFVRHLLALFVIGTVAWLVRNAAKILRDVVLRKYDLEAADNLKARQVYTQVGILQRVVTSAIVILTIAAMLMTFEQVRQIGVSLLASAGVVGIIIGFAAQQSISTLFAGLQIAITQPIRIDDVVIVEGEWGRIEEITLTYVVVRIWDLRRLIVPIKYFIEKPFQHWTRVSADILGTIYLHADWRIPVDAVREELKRVVEEDDNWDHQVVGLVVTDTSERGVELRALVSASDSGKAWDLRCAVREKLIRFVQEKYPHCLPRFRAELESPGELPTGDRRPGLLPRSHTEEIS